MWVLISAVDRHVSASGSTWSGLAFCGASPDLGRRLLHCLQPGNVPLIAITMFLKELGGIVLGFVGQKSVRVN